MKRSVHFLSIAFPVSGRNAIYQEKCLSARFPTNKDIYDRVKMVHVCFVWGSRKIVTTKSAQCNHVYTLQVVLSSDLGLVRGKNV